MENAEKGNNKGNTHEKNVSFARECNLLELHMGGIFSKTIFLQTSNNIQKLSKSYGKTLALNNISLTFDQTGVVGLLGPNGAGKTTLMKILTGYLNQWEGETDVFMELNGIELPYYFKPDFCNLIELKIRSPRLNPPRKDGSRTWSKGSIPKTPYAGWLNQVSVYNSYFNRQPVIVCANNVESKVYHPENGDWMLEQDHLNNTMQNIVQDLKRHEHILRKSDNLEELVQMVIPDWDHISWSSMNPEVLDEAKLLFGVI